MYEQENHDLITLRWQVNKMGGEIKIVKKEGPGTLMRLYLHLNASVDATEQHCQVDFTNNGLVVSSRITLALHWVDCKDNKQNLK